MKKINLFILAALATAAAAVSCQQENLEPEVQDGAQESKTVIVKVTIGDQTKGFSDLDGITWEVGDQIKFATANDGPEFPSFALEASDISDEGHTASFRFDETLLAESRTGWFYSTKCHPNNKNEVEFTLGNSDNCRFEQAVAGEMNSRYLFLHNGTGTIELTPGVEPDASMDIAGTIFRFIPYTTKYNDESVVSVEMSSNVNLVGTVRYFRNSGTYEGVNQVNYANSKNVTVTLTEPFPLEGVTSSANSKGVYMAIAATPEGASLTGYKYVVTTDAATYFFDATEKTLAVKDNEVKNVLLNLDKAERIVTSELVGYVYYDGNPQTDITLPPTAGETGSLGYTVARVCDLDGVFNGAGTEIVGVHEWLYNPKITYYDSEGKVVPEEESWVKAGFMPNQICHWMMKYDANTGSERSMTIVAKLMAPDNYMCITAGENTAPKTFVYTFNVKQNENVTAQISDIYGEALPAAATTVRAGVLQLNGNSTRIQSLIDKYGIVISVNGGATTSVDDLGQISLTVPANDIAISKKYTLTVNYGSQVLATAEFTQVAGESAVDFPEIGYIYGAWQPEANVQNISNNPTSITAWGVVINQVTSDGSNLPDLTVDDIVTKLAIIQKTLGISIGEDLCDDWVQFAVEGGFGEVKILVGATKNETGERRTKTYDVYNADGTPKGTLTVNQDA